MMKKKPYLKRKEDLQSVKNMSLFIRKCVLEKEIYIVDLEPFAQLQGLLYNATNNINQIARAINQSHLISQEQLQELSKGVSELITGVEKEFQVEVKRLKELYGSH